MNNTMKWIGGGLAAAALLLGAAGLYSAQTAEAQPPSPPAVFGGTVMVDGAGAAAGTLVVAMVDGQQCAVATVADGRYQVRVPSTCASAGDTVTFTIGGTTAAESGSWDNTTFNALNLSASTAPDPAMPECPEADGMMGDDMPSEPGGDMPSEPGGDMPSEPGGDMPSEPGGDTMMSDGDSMKSDDCPDDGMMDGDAGMADEMTPEVGDTGTGLRKSGSGSSFPLAAALTLTVLAALTLGGYAVARRRR